MTRPRTKSIEFSRLRLAAFSFGAWLFSKICRLVFLRLACCDKADIVANLLKRDKERTGVPKP